MEKYFLLNKFEEINVKCFEKQSIFFYEDGCKSRYVISHAFVLFVKTQTKLLCRKEEKKRGKNGSPK